MIKKMQYLGWLAGSTMCLTMLGVGANVASAADQRILRGPYVGANAGAARYQIGLEDAEEAGSIFNLETKESDVAWSGVAGWRITRYLGFEIGYGSLGESESSFNVNTPTETATIATTVSAIGASAAVQLFIPFGNWEVNAKFGVLNADVEVITTASVPSGTLPPELAAIVADRETSSVENVFGVGAGYTFKRHYHVRFDAVYIPAVGDEDDTGEIDVSQASVGFQYRF